MATIFDSEFVAVTTEVIRRIAGPLPFSIFIRRGENTYTKLFPKGEEVEAVRFASYETGKGVEDFFVHQDDYRQYLLYVEQVAHALFQQKSAAGEQVVAVIKEMTNLTMLDLVVKKHVDGKSIGYAMTTIKGCIDVLANDPKSLFRVFRLLSRHPYLIKHALMTSVFALLLAKAENLESEKTLTTLGLGALLHDIGMSMMTFDPEERAELAGEERREIQTHPELAKRMLDSVKSVNPEVRMIVLQHHEQPNGRGYPNGLHDKQIYYLAKIVAIADCFSALLCVRPFRDEAFTPVKAIEVMVEDRGKFDLSLLDKFSKIFVTTKAS
ncbi:MAG: HD domain-containing phosphohydrolase [Oligoflexia bacterium]|nr:HD domain-containing phosphohydrolase [Oligoflexia bacterium]